MQALSKTKVKLFSSLQGKKFRFENGLFIAEGLKMLGEALASDYGIEAVVKIKGIEIPASISIGQGLLFEAEEADFRRISTQVNPEGVITVLRIPSDPYYVPCNLPDHQPPGPAFVLAAIQDPGNLGAIIRTSEWFGMPSIICGPGTADYYNPKVLRSSMGSLFRTRLYFIEELGEWLTGQAQNCWCADMQGQPLNEVALPERQYIVLGNESHGVPEEIKKIAGLKAVTIPRIGKAESLNAAQAAAVLGWAMRFGAK